MTASETTPCADSDQAWMLMATVLVLSMFPGVAFFEAGLLRSKNTTTILAQVFCGLAMLSVLWFCFGFSLTFSDTATNGFIGNFDHAFWHNVDFRDCHTDRSISTALYALFQLMFACITPLLMTGAYAERLAWLPFVIFTLAWEVLVYYPVAHWLWSPSGWLAKMGGLDFAGGIVIHTTAGVSSIVAVLMLGRRFRYDEYHGEFPYSSLPNAAVGCTLLWTGWFGFNGGSALASNSSAVVAVTNSQIGACFAACAYMFVIMVITRTPSTIAIMNGAIAGLAGVTPASGYISPQAAMVLGAILGLSIHPGVLLLKHKLRIDDALDVSIVHGLTGIIGSVFIGFCASKDIYPSMQYEGVINSKSAHLLGVQCLAVLVCGAWAAVWSFLILFAIGRFTPIRVSEEHEHAGLDIAVFRERSVHFGDHSFHADPSAGHVQHAVGTASKEPSNGIQTPPAGRAVPPVIAVAGGPRSTRSSIGGASADLAHSVAHQPGQVLTGRLGNRQQARAPTPMADPLRPAEESEAEVLLRELHQSMAGSGTRAAAAWASQSEAEELNTTTNRETRRSRVHSLSQPLVDSRSFGAENNTN